MAKAIPATRSVAARAPSGLDDEQRTSSGLGWRRVHARELGDLAQSVHCCRFVVVGYFQLRNKTVERVRFRINVKLVLDDIKRRSSRRPRPEQAALQALASLAQEAINLAFANQSLATV